MEAITLQIVKGAAGEAVALDSRSFEADDANEAVADKVIADEAGEPEAPELSIKELERILAEAN